MGNLRWGRPWTPAEDAILRRLYQRSPKQAYKALPGRTVCAVRVRAVKLGLQVRRPWTPAEDAILRREWGELGARGLRAKLPGRTWLAIREQALRLRLGPANQGRVSVAEAARRAGYDRKSLCRILDLQGVQVRRVWGERPDAKLTHPHRVVVWDEVREAVERHLAAARAA